MKVWCDLEYIKIKKKKCLMRLSFYYPDPKIKKITTLGVPKWEHYKNVLKYE